MEATIANMVEPGDSVLVAIKGVSGDQALATRLRAAFGNRADFSPSEIEFMEDAAASDLDRVEFSWAFEAALPIAWALGRISQLERPERLVDPASLIDLIEPDDGKAFVDSRYIAIVWLALRTMPEDRNRPSI
jgi:hypothetical protein